MALSLSSGRSNVAAASAPSIRNLAAWLAGLKAARARRAALRGLLDLDHSRLSDLGISRDDIVEAMSARAGRTPAMILNAARARSARS